MLEYGEEHALRDSRPERLRRGTAVIASGSNGFAGLLARFRRAQSGSYLIITALLMPLLIVCLGVASDVGLWLYAHQHMQGAADSAALGAAMAANSEDQVTQANAITAWYGFRNREKGVEVTVNSPPKKSDLNKTTPGAVEVVVKQPQPLFLSRLWLLKPPTVLAYAVAVAGGGTGCLLALDGTVSGAITTQGNSSVVLTGCSLYDNSSSGSALRIGGSASILALSVSVVGGISGSSSITATGGIVTGTAPVADPYAGVSFPPFHGCDHDKFSAKTSETINPGVYCGGMTLNAGAVTGAPDGVRRRYTLWPAP